MEGFYHLTVYVGETGRTLKERVTEHLRDIRLRRDKPINRHFVGHCVKDVKVAVLKMMNDESLTHRQLWEEHYIKQLQTMSPHGCNIKTSL